MIEKRYAGEEALTRMADYVKEKLKVVTVMPSSPAEGQTVLYMGASNSSYIQGGIYKYSNGVWNFISNEFTYKDNSILGAKNLAFISLKKVKEKYSNLYSWDDNVMTCPGITFTFNTTDDSDTVNEIIVSKNNTGNDSALDIELSWFEDVYNEHGSIEVILNGCPEGGSSDTYYLCLKKDSNKYCYDYGEGSSATSLNAANTVLCLTIKSNTPLEEQISFYPMVRLATDTDDTYHVYAPTNRLLNKNIKNELSYRPKEFIGTTAEWNSLSAAVKANYTLVTLTDDFVNTSMVSQLEAEIATKQDALTFDNTPTNGSSNPVTSGGVYTALNGKLTILNMPKSYGALTQTSATELINDIKNLYGTTTGIYRFIKVQFGTTYVGTLEYIYSSGYYISIILHSYTSDENSYHIFTRGSSTVYFTCLEDKPSTISNISIFDTTNTTGSTIAKNTYFYIKGALCKAKTEISSDTTLTENTNYEKVSSGLANAKQDKIVFSNYTFEWTPTTADWVDLTGGNSLITIPANSWVDIVIISGLSYPNNTPTTHISDIKVGFRSAPVAMYEFSVNAVNHYIHFSIPNYGSSSNYVSLYTKTPSTLLNNKMNITMYKKVIYK